jgi:hypothetical protein
VKDARVESSLNRRLLLWLVVLVFHFLLASVGGMFLGFIPEAFVSRLYYNTGLEPFSPMIAISAFLLGYFVSFRLLGGQAASWTWIIGLLWLSCAVRELATGWDASWSPEKTRLGYIAANLFGYSNKCSGTECLYELFFTAPFVASIAYALGAFFRNRRLRAAEMEEGSFSTSASDGTSAS